MVGHVGVHQDDIVPLAALQPVHVRAPQAHLARAADELPRGVDVVVEAAKRCGRTEEVCVCVCVCVNEW